MQEIERSNCSACLPEDKNVCESIDYDEKGCYRLDRIARAQPSPLASIYLMGRLKAVLTHKSRAATPVIPYKVERADPS